MEVRLIARFVLFRRLFLLKSPKHRRASLPLGDASQVNTPAGDIDYSIREKKHQGLRDNPIELQDSGEKRGRQDGGRVGRRGEDLRDNIVSDSKHAVLSRRS